MVSICLRLCQTLPTTWEDTVEIGNTKFPKNKAIKSVTIPYNHATTNEYESAQFDEELFEEIREDQLGFDYDIEAE